MALAAKEQILQAKGIIPVSMLDWDGKLATVIFLGGCNFKCPYCHNPDIVNNSSKLKDIEWEKIEKHILSKKDWIDGVVITGGEPTIHEDLSMVMRRIKVLGLKIKLDTNGALPGALANIIQEELVDFVAMDIKTSFKKYALASNTKTDVKFIKDSVALIKASGVDYEFRTTVVPGIVNMEDILEIARFLEGAKVYYLQQFKNEKVLEPQVFSKKNNDPYTIEELFSFASACNKYVKTKVRQS